MIAKLERLIGEIGDLNSKLKRFFMSNFLVMVDWTLKLRATQYRGGRRSDMRVCQEYDPGSLFPRWMDEVKRKPGVM